MLLPQLALLGLIGLLAACASEAPAPVPAQAAPRAAATPAALPAHMRELSGSLLGVPAGAEVELALLVVDERGIPRRLLASLNLNGSGAALPFRLPFDPASFPLGTRVELRGRASQSGWLILRLPPLRIPAAESRALGALRLEPVP